MTTRAVPLLAIPYPQEINDIPAFAARRDSPAQFADSILNAFEEMLAQWAAQPLVMGIALHPYLVGRPHRLRRALAQVVAQRRAWVTRPGEIAAFRRGLPAGTLA